jgi:DNA-binding MarR family transcriptional regulator
MTPVTDEHGLPKPIGWYLKEADQLITAFFDDAFDRHCITRYHWMVLRTIASKSYINVEAHYEQVKYFLSLSRLNGIVDNLATRGWIQGNENENYKFTETGERLYNAVNKTYEKQLVTMMQGVSEEDYNHVIDTLDRIINNLNQKVSIELKE